MKIFKQDFKFVKIFKMFSKIIRGEILESAPHRMQESLKMFDFRARKRRSTYNLTVGRGKTLSKKNRQLFKLCQLLGNSFPRLSFFHEKKVLLFSRSRNKIFRSVPGRAGTLCDVLTISKRKFEKNARGHFVTCSLAAGETALLEGAN